MLRQLKCQTCGKEALMADKLKNVFCTNECFTSYAKAKRCIPHFSLGTLLDSDEYRHIFYTDENMQMGTQTLKVGESIGRGDALTKKPEMHPTATQVLTVFRGTAKVTFYSEEKTDSITITAKEAEGNEDMVIIPPGTYHLVENIGKKELRLFTIYSPAVY